MAVTPETDPAADVDASVPAGIEVVVISGLSGAGRSTAARCLEDLGWFVVDNLPAELIGTMVDLGAKAGGAVNRIAVVLDVRARVFTQDLAGVIKALDARGYRPRVLYLDASDAALIRRYEANRRAHPLQGEGRLVDGLAAERALLGPLRNEADLIIDTSDLSVHELRDRITDAFPQVKPTSSMTILSFGFKYGTPFGAEMVSDMGYFPYTFWVPVLRVQIGRVRPLSEYVLTRPGAREFIDRYVDLLGLIGNGFEREGKRYVTLAVGCTGGKHRSVAVAEEIGRRLGGQGRSVTVVHRDLGRE
jgi:UPF0042 nucleotide-binding protein